MSLKQIRKIHFKDLRRSDTKEIILESLIHRWPVIITGIKAIAEYRARLATINPKLKDIVDYGWDKGVLRTASAYFTHYNPFADQVEVEAEHSAAQYPETYRKHNRPDIPEHEEVTKAMFDICHE